MSAPLTHRSFPVQATITIFWMAIFTCLMIAWVVLGMWQPGELSSFPEWIVQLIASGAGLTGAQVVSCSNLWMDRMSQYPIPTQPPEESIKLSE